MPFDSTPPSPTPTIFRAVGGTVTFAGSPLKFEKASRGRERLRAAAIEATNAFAFRRGTLLWDAHDQLARAYDQALLARTSGDHSSTRRIS